jgi:hypothetical protein
MIFSWQSGFRMFGGAIDKQKAKIMGPDKMALLIGSSI